MENPMKEFIGSSMVIMIKSARESFAIDIIQRLKKEFPQQYTLLIAQMATEGVEEMVSDLKNSGIDVSRESTQALVDTLEMSMFVTKENVDEFEQQVRKTADMIIAEM